MNKRLFLSFLFFFLSQNGILPSPSSATEEYATATNHECGYCHLSSSGGGELTPAGLAYLDFLGAGEARRNISGEPKGSSASGLFRLLVGYIHILTGFFWFGTILYVHLILKPSYASTGLPRGEVRLGLVSMLVMGVTGAILTAFRVPSWEFLVGTRFGILLLCKIGLFGIMAGTALFVVLVLGPRLKRKTGGAVVSSEEISLDALSDLDGKEGRPACFAYKGTVYEVTESPLWKGGTHLRRHQAGFDLTEQLSLAPHGEEKILKLPARGRLVAASTPKAGLLPKQVFYFLAYMNLASVLMILGILALWKWW